MNNFYRMIKEYSRQQRTNMARKEGLWRHLVGFKINEAERGQTMEDSKCQEICISFVCNQDMSKTFEQKGYCCWKG